MIDPVFNHTIWLKPSRFSKNIVLSKLIFTNLHLIQFVIFLSFFKAFLSTVFLHQEPDDVINANTQTKFQREIHFKALSKILKKTVSNLFDELT